MVPTESAVKELELDISLKLVHNATVKLWPLKVRWWQTISKKMELKGFTLLESK